MMLQNQDYSEVIERILKEIDAEMVILFGSRARGHSKPDSDLDLLIIQKEEFTASKNRWAETIKIRKALSDIRIPGLRVIEWVILYLLEHTSENF